MKTRKNAKNHLIKTRSKKRGGAKMPTVGHYYENPSLKLLDGVSANDYKMVEEAFKEGADVNIKNDNGAWFLFVAAVPHILIGNRDANEYANETNSIRIVNLLLEKGVDVNITDRYNNTALLTAVKNGKQGVVKLLLEKGADINKANNFGGTILMSAINYSEEEVIEILLAYDEEGVRVDVNARNYNGETALIRAVENGNSEIVTTLVQAGADMNIRDNYGNTPLIRASMIGKEYILEVLLDLGADVNAHNNAGDTALIMASRRGHYAAVEMLVTDNWYWDDNGIYRIDMVWGTDVNAMNNEGETAFWVAYNPSETEDIGLLLLDAGADDGHETDDEPDHEPSANLPHPKCMTEAEYKKCEIPDFHEENEKGLTKGQWKTDKKPECSISTEEIEIEDAVKLPTQPTKCFQRAALREWLKRSKTNPLDREPVEESWIVGNMGDQPCEPHTEGGKRKSKRKTKKSKRKTKKSKRKTKKSNKTIRKFRSKR